MKRTRQLSIAALCTAAVLGFGLSSCDDDAGSANGKLNASCNEKAPCEEGLICSDEGKCVEKKAEEPTEPEKAKLGEACGEDKACEDDLVCNEDSICAEKPQDPVDPDVNPDPCQTANCADGTTCIDAKCIDNECVVDGAEKTCDAGQMCVKGDCVDDGCVDKQCDDGFMCVKGLCEDTVCHEKNIVCNPGSTCVKGNCVDNECLSETCDTGLVCSKGACIHPACLSIDPCANGKICNIAGECVFENDPALVVTADDLETDETGDSAVISIKLNNPPQSAVMLDCEIATESPVPEAEVHCENIHFDESNYGEDQTITVLGLPDNLVDADQKFTVKLMTKSDDADFTGLTKSLDMVNKNIDTVGLKISETELITTESGGTATFNISLITQPTADVTIQISSSNPGYGTVKDANEEGILTLTFTPENWDTPQSVEIKGEDDEEAVNSELHVYEINFKTQSEDTNYSDLQIPPIKVTNVDNDVADIFVDKTEIETSETGGPVPLNIRLGLAPDAPVTISATLLVSENNEKEESPEVAFVGEGENLNEITLTKDNYKEGLNITVQGQPDNIIDGDKDYIVRLRAYSQDSNYYGKQKIIHGKNLDTDKAEITKKYESTIVSEDGTSTDIMLSLASIPTAPVKLTLNTSNAEELLISTKEMTFTPDDWNVEQKLTVTGEDDLVIDGDQISKVLFRTESEDSNFNQLVEELEITTLDNDKAQIVVASSGMEILENSTVKPEFKVKLSAQPAGKVTVKMKSSDETAIKILGGQSTLIFDAENWNNPQVVILEVQDDSQADGTQYAHIDLTSTSADDNFNGLKASTEDYSILDNESASVTLTPAKKELRPGGYTTSMTVALSSAPVGDVTVTLSSSHSKITTFDKTTLTFTTENWNQPQTVTITNNDPHSAPAAMTEVTLTGTTSGQGQYNNLKGSTTLKIYEFESQAFAYSGKHEAITLLPGSYKLQVWGAAGGESMSDWAKAGPGGYAEGVLNLKAKTSVWVVVGGRGNASQCKSPGVDGGGGGYNGGGASYNTGWGGGGGTDIRLLKDDLYNRVIVAGGGGGGALCYYSTVASYKGNGGYGGGVTGGSATGDTNLVVTYAGATQTSGYKFGIGQDAYNRYQCGGVPYGGGGGGWYGGYARDVSTYAQGTAGSGGSGYVNTSSSSKPSGYALTSADYFLSSTKLIGGNAAMPSTNGGTETGHQGNGYAIITLND